MDYIKVFRATVLAAVAAVAVLGSLVLFQQLVVPVLVWFFPSLDVPFYDLGLFGACRRQDYVSFNLTAPLPSLVTWDESCEHGYVFLDPSGPSVGHAGPLIMDGKGELVWTSDRFETTTNSKIQRYKGREYLTFWSGLKARTSGTGIYYMLHPNYTVAHTVDAVGEGLHGDLHEFKITGDDTALITVYAPAQADLTGMGWFRTDHGWIVDNILQEIDIETGELLFEWRASDHFRAEDSHMTNPFGGYRRSAPFDFFHLNSVEKCANGNYLISSRHFHAVYEIDRHTGAVRWGLGGATDDFRDLSDGRASDFSWQHDARWLSEADGILSLFDNSYAWPHSNAPYSQGRIIQLDRDQGTATLLHSFLSLQHARSSSQGSLQMLPAAHGEPHVFIGWGSSAAYGEYTADGRLLCETHFAASAFFWWERVKSYRAFKALDWSAIPAEWNPSAAIAEGNLYVSWNGATEVVFWELQGRHDAEGDGGVEDGDEWTDVDVREKTAFEEMFVLPSEDAYREYRVAALDAERNVLRFSNVVVTTREASGVEGSTLAAGSALLGVAMVVGACVAKRRGWKGLDCGRWAILGTYRSKYHKLR